MNCKETTSQQSLTKYSGGYSTQAGVSRLHPCILNNDEIHQLVYLYVVRIVLIKVRNYKLNKYTLIKLHTYLSAAKIKIKALFLLSMLLSICLLKEGNVSLVSELLQDQYKT